MEHNTEPINELPEKEKKKRKWIPIIILVIIALILLLLLLRCNGILSCHSTQPAATENKESPDIYDSNGNLILPDSMSIDDMKKIMEDSMLEIGQPPISRPEIG